MDLFGYRDGGLWAEGVRVGRIVEAVGTPTYVYSAGTLRAHHDRVSSAFAELSPAICFSIKACSNLSVLRVLVERGAGLDAVSGGEIERAFLAGCPMSRVVYAGVGKSAGEIAAALDGRASPLWETADAGARERLAERGPIGLFNIESEPEFEAVSGACAARGVVAEAALRINPGVDPGSHAHTATGRSDSKFGVDVATALDLFSRRRRDRHLRPRGLHIHIGSPVRDPADTGRALDRVLELADELERRGHKITTLDVGGGFGADYLGVAGATPADYAAVVVPRLRSRVARGLRVILEPGRMIAANAGILLTRVLYVKRTPTRTFVIVDAGMNTLIRPALYDAFHFIWPTTGDGPARRDEDPGVPGLERCDIVGPICESGDFLARERLLPAVRAGDVLAVFAAGAYGMTMASTYNSHPLPAEVLVDGEEFRVARARQSVGAMIGPEVDAAR